MIADSPLVTGIVAFVIGYMLGSIPSAYIFTRLATGGDIRKLGGGNVGGLNTLREVGLVPAIGATLLDFGKGAATVAVAHWLLGLEPLYVFLAAGAAVVGHNWMVWLGFDGGKGMGATVGALVVLMPVYGYLTGLWIVLGLIVVPLAVTRNVALSMGVGLIALPFIAWLTGTHSGLFAAWAGTVGLLIVAKFAPTAIDAMRKTTGVKDFIRGQ
jgi:glycerol-3-phosphate acyltransferase PlsY